MNARQDSQADLVKLFSAVTRTLQENKATLNSADDYNHNHGDNMVDTFRTITQAVREKKTSQPSEQLAYASQKLSQQSQSGSAQPYAQGLQQASTRFQGQSGINADNALQLVQALMGGQDTGGQTQAASAGGVLTDLLGSFLGSQAPSTGPTGQDSGGMTDLLGSLLVGQTPAGQAQGAEEAGGFDLNALLNAGMRFFQARQQGSAPAEAIAQALMSGSPMNSSAHRAQSGQLVANTLINVIGSMVGGSNR